MVKKKMIMQTKILSYTKGVITGSFQEIGYKQIPRLRLSDEAYGLALQSMVPVCSDALLVNPQKRLFYLARRRAKPMAGWWVIGGRVFADETTEEGMIRCFKRETNLILSAKRFKKIAVFDYFWRNREQEPQDLGVHLEGHIFRVDVNNLEIETIGQHLDKDEYHSKGLRPFTRDELLAHKVHPALVLLYDHVFPE